MVYSLHLNYMISFLENGINELFREVQRKVLIGSKSHCKVYDMMLGDPESLNFKNINNIYCNESFYNPFFNLLVLSKIGSFHK